ncbi:DUF6252 family protein [Formosa sp. A9]|uniref:DUF6252 family protein n=1 Tax=Formosa sp. A9 TaxID=3442641 RepID=UPI003EC0540D
MRFWVCLLVISVCISSCGDDIEFNSPAFQADKDGVLWKSQSRQARNDDGGITVSGKLGSETVALSIPSATIDTFQLGAGKIANANYTNASDTLYSTLYNPVDDPSTPEDESLVYYAEGEIVIDDINTTENYVSGSFWFTAYDGLGEHGVNFNKGVFYRVPFLVGN